MSATETLDAIEGKDSNSLPSRCDEAHDYETKYKVVQVLQGREDLGTKFGIERPYHVCRRCGFSTLK